MSLYCGIDLHSNNHVICVIDDKDHRILEKKLINDVDLTIELLLRYRKRLKAIAVESTFNWHWLVDGLIEAGFQVELVNTAPRRELLETDSKKNAGAKPASNYGGD